MSAPNLTESLVEWLRERADWHERHRYGACDCANVAEHTSSYHALLARKHDLLGEMQELAL